MYDLSGKVALVTGAAGKRGMGHAVALSLAQQGANVAVSDISLYGVRQTEDDRIEEWQGLKSTEAEIMALGRKGLAIEADVSSSKQVTEMVKQCITEFGKIDILVNNAGIVGPRPVPAIEVSDEDWNRVLAVNLTGTYLCSKAVAKSMIERGQGGKIVNFASIAGKVARPGLLSYSVSKFGVVGLTQVLALELAQYRIHVNAVCPGIIGTELLTEGASIRGDARSGINLEEAAAKSFARFLKDIPLGLIGQPEDVAKVVVFLASSESDYMTGQSINVSGGLLMCP